MYVQEEIDMLRKTSLSVVVLAAMSFATPALGAEAAKSQVFDFTKEAAKGDPRTGFTLKQMVQTPEYTAGAIVVKERIPMHRHKDGNHVIYVVKGSGSATLDGKEIKLDPGTVVHIPKGSTHDIRARGGEMHIIDFAHPPFDPAQMEWIK
jgi:quercetin dioxygenase-like cupin family protein